MKDRLLRMIAANGLMRMALMAILAVVCLVAMPLRAEAVVAKAQGWTLAGLAYTTAYPAGTVGTIAVNAGTNRLLVVAISSNASTSIAQTISTPTWNGVAMTQATSTHATAAYGHTSLWYLKDAQLPVGTTSASLAGLTILGGTATGTWVYYAVYTGVVQDTTLIAQSFTAPTLGDTAVGPFSPSLSIPADAQAIQIINMTRNSTTTTARTMTTYATGWGTGATTVFRAVAYPPRVYITDRTIPTVLTADPSQHLASGAVYDALSALIMPNWTCSAVPPTDLATSSVSALSVGLTWTPDLVNNDSYNVYRNGVLQASNVLVGSYSDTTTAATAYTAPGYTVRGVATCGTSVDSNAVPVTTPAIVNGTTVGALSYSAVGMNGMTVTAAYSGDDNNSNTCTIIYSTSGTYSPFNTATANRVGKSWVANISGLSESTLYYVRATFNDADATAVNNVNVNGSQSTTANPLIHNSANLGTKFAPWGAAFTCATCHVSGSANIKRIANPINLNAVSASDASIYGINNGTVAVSQQVCEVCHTQTSVHRKNMSVLGPVAHYGNNCVVCHKHTDSFSPPKDCTLCHFVGNTYGAPAVTAASPHTKADGLVFGGCTDCHTGHYSATGGVNIPNKVAAGINYGHGGIKLGGPGTVASINAKTTEAEICWGCHEVPATDISEWGTNTGGTYNYGTVTANDLNWTTTTWASAKFSYKGGLLKTRPIRGNALNATDVTTRGDASLHATGGTVGTQSNTLAQVQCSYCHDVHDSYGVTGKPYLRAAWRPNPYREDGAPRAAAQTYSATQNFGSVPRGGGTNLTVDGGWQIDINNANPNSAAYAYATQDALCASCHTQATVETAAPLHKNSVKGFTNDLTANTTAATNRNILRVGAYTGTDFNPSRGGTMTSHSAVVGSPRMGYNIAADTGTTATEQDGLRDIDGNNLWISGNTIYNLSGSSTTRYAYQAIPLSAAGVSGVTQDLVTVQADYHSFTCSKCHNPHASRLPRLMITNCLDVNNNTWDDTLTLTTNTGYTQSTANNPSTINTLAYFSSAQNCHRYTENASGATRGTVTEKGWNAVTPW